MAALQWVCAAIVAIYLAVRAQRDKTPAALFGRFVLLAVAGWIGEDTCIRAYGLYAYERDWWLFLDRVPLMIVVIWPVVIDSAHLLARRVLGERAGPGAVALTAAAFVLADASLIEPVSVRAGLWRWTEPGLFAVPLIGIAGWAYFAGACVAVFEHNARRRPAFVADIALIPIAPLLTHALLLASWWSALRWVKGTVPGWVAALAAWCALVPLAAIAWRRGTRRRVPAPDILVRLPGALFFFALLAMHGRNEHALVVYALSFAPPYLALVPWPTRAARAQP